MNVPIRLHGKPHWLAWLLAAPMPILGMVVGHLTSMSALERANADFLARNPNLHVCGLMVLPYLVLGIGGGAVVGILGGAAVGGIVEIVMWVKRRRRARATSPLQ